METSYTVEQFIPEANKYPEAKRLSPVEFAERFEEYRSDLDSFIEYTSMVVEDGELRGLNMFEEVDNPAMYEEGMTSEQREQLQNEVCAQLDVNLADPRLLEGGYLFYNSTGRSEGFISAGVYRTNRSEEGIYLHRWSYQDGQNRFGLGSKDARPHQKIPQQ